ncbi:MAG: hypothetical protein AAB779_04390 [Patescibacteria group bacterium]
MLSGEITRASGNGYLLTLPDGQSLQIERQFLPASLQQAGQKVNLLFGGVEAAGVEPAETRALLNSLLFLG